jgi:hypothetical protein
MLLDIFEKKVTERNPYTLFGEEQMNVLVNLSVTVICKFPRRV